MKSNWGGEMPVIWSLIGRLYYAFIILPHAFFCNNICSLWLCNSLFTQMFMRYILFKWTHHNEFKYDVASLQWCMQFCRLMIIIYCWVILIWRMQQHICIQTLFLILTASYMKICNWNAASPNLWMTNSYIFWELPRRVATHDKMNVFVFVFTHLICFYWETKLVFFF